MSPKEQSEVVEPNRNIKIYQLREVLESVFVHGVMGVGTYLILDATMNLKDAVFPINLIEYGNAGYKALGAVLIFGMISLALKKIDKIIRIDGI